jgi:hypothetical protein
VLGSSFLLLGGVASAHGAPAYDPAGGGCTVKSLKSFIAQGEFGNAGTAADVIEVSCDPFTYSAGAEVEVTASQLYDRCHDITWYEPNVEGDYTTSSGRGVTLKLDTDGNANVGLIAGPKCMVGESLITVDELEEPYETYTTSFIVEPDEPTPPGLTILDGRGSGTETEPTSQVEDSESSGVVAIAEAEFTKASEAHVRIASGQLYARCQDGEHMIIVNEDGYSNAGWTDPEELDAINLDNDGNGFVLLIGSDSCAEGPSLVEADLEESPYTTYKSDFVVNPPKVRFGHEEG